MPLSFPANPTVGQTYNVGTRTWTWDGTIWSMQVGTLGVASVSSSNLVDGAVTTDKVAANAITQAKLASTLSAITICTSSTRPSSPYEGQMIYETDTDLPQVYQGAQWVRIVGLSTSNRVAFPASGTIVTETATGRGLGIAASSGDTSAILQFTNNAIGSQWATLVATSPGNLTINAETAINTNIPIQNSVAQVIHTIYSTNYSRTSTSGRVDITGWNMSITPKKAGNKIIILVQAAVMAICDGYMYLKKNGTEIASPLMSFPRTDFSNDDATFYGQYIDTAASTSAITYQFSAQATGCQGFFGVNSQGGVSSTILIEVQS